MVRVFEINGFGVPQSTQAAIQRGDLSVLSDWEAQDWGSLIQWVVRRVYSPRLPNVPLTLGGQPVSAAAHRWIPEAAAANLLQQITQPAPRKGCWWDATGRLTLPDDPDQCAKLLTAFTKIMADIEAHADVFAVWDDVRQAIAARAPAIKKKGFIYLTTCRPMEGWLEMSARRGCCAFSIRKLAATVITPRSGFSGLGPSRARRSIHCNGQRTRQPLSADHLD